MLSEIRLPSTEIKGHASVPFALKAGEIGTNMLLKLDLVWKVHKDCQKLLHLLELYPPSS